MRKYFRSQFNAHNLRLEHDSASDFYVSCWQRSRSVLPLLFIRLVLFLGCLAILLASLILTAQSTIIQYWPIYLTHWGLICITLTTGAAFAVSCVAYFRGPIGKYLVMQKSIRYFGKTKQRKFRENVIFDHTK